MKVLQNAIIRRIESSLIGIVMIIVMALSVFLVSSTTVNAQTPSGYGKFLIVNGKLVFIPTVSHTIGSTLSSGGVYRYFHYELLGSNFAKVDYITKSADKHQALRVNGTDFAICLMRKNPQDGSSNNNGSVPFSGSLKVSSASTRVPTVAQEEKSDNKENSEGNAAPSRLYPILVLLQDKSGRIRLLIQTDDSTLLDYQVYNMWELFITIPEKCQNDFFDLMKFYSPGIFVSKRNTLDRIYNAISQSVPVDQDVQKRYQQLIEDLSSDVYLKRATAMDQIQNEGLNFLGFAQKLDLNQLDPEARIRLVNILNNLLFINHTDDIEDMSVLFANSIYAFIPLLESDNSLYYSVAQKRLKENLGDSFQFDKSAPDDVRAAQIQELKTKLEFPKPITIQMDEQTQKRFNDLIDSLLDPSFSIFKF